MEAQKYVFGNKGGKQWVLLSTCESFYIQFGTP